MIFIWRGWGLLAFFVLIPLLASCGGLIELEPSWVFIIAVSLSLLFAGAVCVYCGIRWNRYGVEHSLYFVPLEAWGWIYLAFAGLMAFAAVGGAIRQGFDKPRFLYQGIAGAASLAVVVGLSLLLPKLARTRTDTQDSAELDDTDPWDR